MADVPRAALHRFYRQGFSLNGSPTTTIPQAQAWLAREAALQSRYRDNLPAVIDEAAELYQDETGCCPWCGELRHDVEEEER